MQAIVFLLLVLLPTKAQAFTIDAIGPQSVHVGAPVQVDLVLNLGPDE